MSSPVIRRSFRVFRSEGYSITHLRQSPSTADKFSGTSWLSCAYPILSNEEFLEQYAPQLPIILGRARVRSGFICCLSLLRRPGWTSCWLEHVPLRPAFSAPVPDRELPRAQTQADHAGGPQGGLCERNVGTSVHSYR